MKSYAVITKAITYIAAHYREQPSLETIAASCEVSPFYLQRLFTAWAGVSPKKLSQYLSLERAKSILLSERGSVTRAAHQSGLSGTGRLHDLFVTIEGMTPGEYKNGGEGLAIFYSFHDGLFGKYLVAATSKGVCRIIFCNDFKEALQDLRVMWPKARYSKKITPLQEQVAVFFNQPSKKRKTAIKLHVQGTPFQLKVWEALLTIPEGAMVSYASLAKLVRKPTAQRAVGSAVGDNPVAYLIPCHRVIKSTGEIGNYHWGVARKNTMIAWEAARLEQSL